MDNSSLALLERYKNPFEEAAERVNDRCKKLGLGTSRLWSVIVYPHADKRVIDGVITETFAMRGLCGCLSPLHDNDIDTLGHLKDPHYHLMIKSSCACSAAFALYLDYILNGNFAPVEKVRNEQAVYYYHCHLFEKNDSGKSLYRDEDRTLYNGYTPAGYDKLLEQLFKCADNFDNLHDLVVYLRAYRLDLIPHVEKYYRTLKAFYGKNY